MTAFQRTALFVSLLSCVFGISARGQGFVSAPVLPVAGDPQLLATGDFNADGRPDLVYLDALNGGSLHVLIGNGDGSFHTSQVIAIAANITGQIDVADLNGDGIPDLALGGAGVTTLLGRGDGTFGSPVTTPSFGSASGHAAIADFDGDGKADVFLASSGTNVILKGDGKGGFAGTIPLSGASMAGPDAFAVDLNGDGRPDLLSDNGNFSFSVALNQGGSFAPPVFYSTPQKFTGPRYLAMADVNGDGRPDVLFPGLYANPGQLIAALGRADGTFATSAPVANTGLHNFRLVGSADLHSDGHPRVFLAGPEGFGTVLGSSPAGTPMFEGSSLRQEQTVLADINGDGIMDTATPDSHSIVILFGKNDGTFASPQAQQIGSTTGPIQIADANGDNIPDLLATTELIFAGTGDGSFASTPLQTPSGYGTGSYEGGGVFPFYPANFNGDGKLDLLALPESFLLGDGHGGFTRAAEPRFMGTPFYYGAVADFDGDGLDDGVEIALGGAPPPLGGVNIFMSRAQAFNRFGLPNNETAGPAATGDFDGDGCQDLAVAGAKHVVLYKGDCHGNLNYTQNYSFDLPPTGNAQVSTAPGDITRADVDGDGHPDLIFTLPLLNEAQVLYGNGDGTFTPGTPIALSRTATFVSAADLDGDGCADLVFSGIGDPILLYGSANRTFGPERVLAAGFQTGKVALADLRSAGRIDMVLPNLNSHTLDISQTVGYTYARFLNAAPAAGTSAVTFALTLPGSSVVYGSSVTATVSVRAANSAAVPSGFVSLQIDGVPFASAALNSQGQASVPLKAVDAGSHTVQLLYLGDVNFRTAAASGSLNVAPATTTLSLAIAPAPSTTVQPLTLAATVTGSGTVPGGQVTFAEGATILGSAPLNATGTAILSLPAFSAGAHTITATFPASQDFLASQNTFVQQVNPALTSTTVTVTPTSSYLGSSVNVSVAVASSVTSPYPTGLVTCSDGTLLLGTATLTGGTGTLSTTALPAGSSNIVCTYGGDALFATSTSANIPVNVSVRFPSTITLTSSAAGAPVTTVNAGTTVMLSAQVNSHGGLVPQGQILFCDSTSSSCNDIHQLGLVQLTTAGSAALAITPAPGVHSYSARFLGLPSAQPIQSATSSLTVTGSILSTATLASTSASGSTTLTAQLSGVGPAPTGSVLFLDTSNANAMLGTAALSVSTSTTPFSATTLSTPGSISAVVTADLNGDGHPDLAVATGPNGGILILVGRGDGTFNPGQTLQTVAGSANAQASSLVFGDFNGDGHLDLAAVNNVDHALTIFPGVGDGTFSNAPVRSTATSAYTLSSLATADLNGDGKADLVGASPGDNAAVFLLGNGDGTFQNITTQTVAPNPHKVVIGDFNEDGNPDLLLTSGGQGSLSELLGNGDGTFRSTGAPALGGAPFSAVAADLNGDGHLDLAVVDNVSATVRILLGNGDGTFQIQGVAYLTGNTPTEISFGDFDGDGKADLAVTNELGASVTLLLGNGDGTFTTATVPTGVQPAFLGATDLNGDGRTDLVVGNMGETDATLLLAQGSTLATAALSNLAPLGLGTHLVQASYAGDGNYAPRLTNTVALVAQAISTTLSLAVTPAQSTYGQSVVFTATLSPATAGTSTSNGETIHFLSGTSVIATCTLQAGTCSSTAPALNAGSYTVTAQYAGDAALAASTSSPSALAVQAVTTSITFAVANHTFGDAPFPVVASSLSGGSFGYSVISGPASVTGTSVTLTGAGTVVLRVDQQAFGNYTASSQTTTFTVAQAGQTIHLTVPPTAIYGSSPLAVTAQASSNLPVALSVLSGPATLSGNLLTFTGTGAVVLAADQNGNANYAAAPQVRQTIQVSPATVSLNWSPPGTVAYGSTLQSVLTATATAGSLAVPGSFTYTLGGSPLSATTVLNAGSYTLQAAFTPTDATRFTSASATAPLTVSKAVSSIVLTTPSSSVFAGNPVVMTANVSSAAGAPTGTVTFMNGTTVLGTSSLNSGVAQLSVASLPVGTQTLTATFSGGMNFLGSTSGSIAEAVQDLTLTTPTQTPVVTATGSTATTSFVLNATGETLPQAVTFSASGLPAGATATFNPASLPAGSIATSVNVTFNLPSNTAHNLPHESSSGIALATLLLLPAWGLRSRRKLRSLLQNRQTIALAAVFTVVLMGAAGCGGSSNSTPSPTPTPTSKSYVVTLTATSGALQRSTTITLQVSQ